jgi:anion-transporting  ArsA/GET3 family ATPase
VRAFGQDLVVVTGKGGVGKSTVAAALGLAAARRGLRTIVAEVAARDDVSRALAGSGTRPFEERAVADNLFHISIDPERRWRSTSSTSCPCARWPTC